MRFSKIKIGEAFVTTDNKLYCKESNTTGRLQSNFNVETRFYSNDIVYRNN